MLPLRIILHPTDFSDTADGAYRVARMLARECDARLVVLHVVGMHIDLTPIVQEEMGVPLVLPKDYQAYLATLRDRLREKYGPDREPHAETRLEVGDAAEEILRTADEIGCDLIVMGTHGRTGVGRLVLGSVAEAVLRRALCPVLTLRSPQVARGDEPARDVGDAAGRRDMPSSVESADRASVRPAISADPVAP